MAIKKLLTLSILGISTTAFGAVDWTSHLKGMQSSCNTYAIAELAKSKTLPKALRPSLVKRQGKISESDGKVTWTLKNATAFGQPLTKITYSRDGHTASSVTLYFANDGFMKLLPSFAPKFNGKALKAGQQKSWINVQLLQPKRDSKGEITATVLKSQDYEVPYLKEFSEEFWYQQARKKIPNYENIVSSGYDDSTPYYSFTGYSVGKTGYFSEPIEPGSIEIFDFDKKSKTIKCMSDFVS